MWEDGRRVLSGCIERGCIYRSLILVSDTILYLLLRWGITESKI